MNQSPPPPINFFSLTALLLLPLLLGLMEETQAQQKPTVTIAAIGGTAAMRAPSPGPSSVSTGECQEFRRSSDVPVGQGWRRQGSSNYWCTGTTTDSRPTKQFRVRSTNWPSGKLVAVQAKVRVSTSGNVIIGAKVDDGGVLSGGYLHIWLEKGQTRTFTVRLSGSYSSGSFKVALVEHSYYKDSDYPDAVRRNNPSAYNIGSPSSIKIGVNPYFP